MKLLLIMAILLSSLFGCAAVPSVPRPKVRLADREIRVHNGAFAFKNVILDAGTLPGSWIITGIVQNNTGATWKQAIFDFQLYDMSRSIMNSYLDSPISVTVHSLQNGEEQQFATNYFKSLRPDAFQSVWKYEVTYKGTDSEKQMFIMVK